MRTDCGLFGILGAGAGGTRLLLGVLLGTAALLPLAAEPAQAKERAQGKSRTNPRALARIELGRRLFFDPQVSQGGQHSCASCHAPAHGFSDPDRGSTDSTGITPRHSQTILDAAYNPTAHWDGEFSSVEELVTKRLGSVVVYYGRGSTPRGPITPPRRRGPLTSAASSALPLDGNFDRPRRRFLRSKFVPAQGRPSVVADRLNAGGRYTEAFRSAFGSDEATLERLALAIAAYCYSIESTESSYDRYKAGDRDALSASARRGLVLFEGRAGCFECHSSKGRHPLFTDYRFHDTGIAWDNIQHAGATDTFEGMRRKIIRENARGDLEAAPELIAVMDKGRMRLSGRMSEARAFKTPTLRDVALRGPYMHDGRLETLADVVRYYADGCGDDPAKSKLLKPFQASDRDVEDLTAFLESLTGLTRPGRATHAWKRRTSKTRLEFVQANGVPFAHVKVRLIPVGDEQPEKGTQADKAVEGLTDKNGVLTYAPGSRTHMRVVIPGGLQITNGALIPDTCRKATVTVPKAGLMIFVVSIPRGAAPPPLLVADHVVNSPSATPTRTVFKCRGVADADRTRVVTYAGWVRDGLPAEVVLRMPGLEGGKTRIRLPTAQLALEPSVTRRIDLTGDAQDDSRDD